MTPVAVIIPTYNRWPQVCSAIDSVLAQSYPHIQCLVVDDASSDDSVQRLRAKYGDLIDVIANPGNRGQSYCRNQGASACSAEYICFLDSDDVFDKHAVAARMALIDKSPQDIKVVFGLFRKAGRSAHSLKSAKAAGDSLTLSDYLADMSWLCNNSFLIERDFFLSAGGYNPQLRNREDIELLIRLLAARPFYFCGEEIGQIQDICSNRARNDYVHILEPKNSFAHLLQSNPSLGELLGPHRVTRLLAAEVEEQLRAYYHLGRFAEYRTLFRQALAQKHILLKGKGYKRFALSYLRGLFKGNPMLGEVVTEVRHSRFFSPIKGAHARGACDIELLDFCQAQGDLCATLDDLIAKGFLYKSDSTSTVASVQVQDNHWLIKRYNHKGLPSTLKLLARASRAERAFHRALLLRKLHIATPQPLLYVVRYRKHLPYCCYIVSEKSQGDTLCNLFDNQGLSAEQWPVVVNQVADMLAQLHAQGITHGDIKPTNLLYHNGRVELIDLDAMRVHWLPTVFDRFKAKDYSALKRRVGGYIDKS